MTKETHILILKESLIQSLFSDLGSFFTFAAMVGLGVYLTSPAMQWVGAIAFLMVMIGRASKAGKRFTIQEARTYLDELEKSKTPDFEP